MNSMDFDILHLLVTGRKKGVYWNSTWTIIQLGDKYCTIFSIVWCNHEAR